MTTPVPETFDEARRRLRAQAAEARERREALRETAAAVHTAHATVRSTDGTVSVTASADGAVTDVTVTESALDDTPARLSRTLTATVAAAQRGALENAAAASAERWGEGHPLVAELRQSAQRFTSEQRTWGYE